MCGSLIHVLLLASRRVVYDSPGVRGCHLNPLMRKRMRWRSDMTRVRDLITCSGREDNVLWEVVRRYLSWGFERGELSVGG